MRRTLFLGYGLFSYALFLVTFLYAIGFVSGLLVPKSIDSGDEGALVPSIVTNVLLLGLFGIQHSIMARRWFKSWWTRIVPEPIERSTFMVATCVVFGLLFWLWQPLHQVIWSIESDIARQVIWGAHWAGWAIALISTFIIDHFELFGLRQVIRHYRGVSASQPTFKVSLFYRFVRHPLMLGFIIAFWTAPHMTLGRLLFAAVTTAYILVAVQIEERDLVRAHGESYREYRRRVPSILPLPRLGGGNGKVVRENA
ncbi:MAG TPA: isoprenylcysteine carboxylmethyltransferase family protein [Planctomycetota bacterium]|nr:isoprenylcysteine carboxylmethyltransferase family protein [Planctomycetota bacterium]